MNTICIIFCIVIVFSLFTEKYRPKNSKYSLYIINQNFIYERVTPEKEGFNSDNEIANFEIVKFIDEKGSVIIEMGEPDVVPESPDVAFRGDLEDLEIIETEVETTRKRKGV
jgi:hypothetical protein